MSEKQIPLIEAETTWFHIFNSMIKSGDLKEMGMTCFGIYCTIKAFTNWKTGHSFPKIETITEHTGLSKSTVIRAIETLVQMGYITKSKKGKLNKYTLRERVEIKDGDGRPAATASWDYLPASIKDAQAEIKNFLTTMDTGNLQYINIENLTLNIQHIEKCHTANQNIDSSLIAMAKKAFPDNPEIAERLVRLHSEQILDDEESDT